MKRRIPVGARLRRLVHWFTDRNRPHRPRLAMLACEPLEMRRLLAPLGLQENLALPLDYGDAPAATYPTKMVDDGARHVAESVYRLGEKIDAEWNGLADAAALGDDRDNLNDDDGVRFTSAIRAGEVSTVEVYASANGGFLNAWIDANADGVWDAGDQIFRDQPLVVGINQLEFEVPPAATVTRLTFARFRYSTQTGLLPTGWAPNGEVEDYAVAIAGPAGGADQIGAARAAGFYLDANGNDRWDGQRRGDVVRTFGSPSDTPITGDWNGDGRDEVGVFRSSNGKFYLDANGNGRWDPPTRQNGDVVCRFGGRPTDTPVVGDFNGDGYDEIGLHRNNKFFLDANGNGHWDKVLGGDLLRTFGLATDTPIVGDFNGDGTDDVGVHRGNKFFVDANGNGRWDGDGSGGDQRYRFRKSGETPVIGDFNGDGTDNIGTRAAGVFYLDFNGNGRWDGWPGGDQGHRFLGLAYTPLAGKWKLPPG